MPKPARRPKEPGVGSAERLGTGGVGGEPGPQGDREGDEAARRLEGAGGTQAGRGLPKGQIRRATARPARRPKDREGTGPADHPGDRIRKVAEGATKPTRRLEGARGRADRGLLPEETGSAGRLGPKTTEGAEGRDPGLAENPASSREQPRARREPCSGPGATRGSQGALLRAEDSDELAGGLAPGRERDPIRKALESEVGTREKTRSSGGRRATMRGERAARSCPQDRRRKGGAREGRAARRLLPG